MADEKIDIGLKVTGADAAAGEVRKVTTGMDGMLEVTKEQSLTSEERAAAAEEERRALERLEAASKEYEAATKESTAAQEKAARAADLKRQREEDLTTVLNRRRNAEMEAAQAQDREASAVRGRMARVAAGVAVVGGVATKVMGEVDDLLGELGKISPETAKQFEGVEKALAAVADPIGSFLSWASGSGDALEGLRESVANAAAVRKNVIGLLVEIGNEEVAALREQARVSEQAAKVLEAARGANAAEADLADARAVRGGASELEVRANRVAGDAGAAAGKMEEDLTPLRDEIDALGGMIGDFNADIQRVREMYGDQAPELDVLTKQLESAQAEFDAKGNELDTQRAVNAERLREMEAVATAELEEITATAGGAITERAEETMKLIEEAAQARGEEISGTARTAFEMLGRIVTDATPDSQQVDGVRQAMDLFRQSQQAYNETVFQRISELRADLEKDRQLLNRLDQQSNGRARR
jgi:chromosome segregation ATPase